jgi:hypothetical protein
VRAKPVFSTAMQGFTSSLGIATIYRIVRVIPCQHPFRFPATIENPSALSSLTSSKVSRIHSRRDTASQMRVHRVASSW